LKNWLISILFIITYGSFADVALVDCDNGFNQQFHELSVLANSVDGVGQRVASDLAKDYIKKLCYKGKSEGENIRFRDSKINFYIYSDTFDVSDKYFFCKNKKGYRSYLSRIRGTIIRIADEKVQRQTSEIRQTRQAREIRETRESTPRSQTRQVASTSSASSSTSEQMYKCILPGYIKTVRKVTEAQKLGIALTYGEESCSPIN
tara:strand:- start:122965 stop:123579 length:615 start_codon:yes stop_codon:yes gene_type:complete